MEKYSPNTSADNAKEDGRKIKENYSRKKKSQRDSKDHSAQSYLNIL